MAEQLSTETTSATLIQGKTKKEWIGQNGLWKLKVSSSTMNVGTAKTVVLKNSNKYNLMYEAILSCSPTRKTYLSEENKNSPPPGKTGSVDSGATHLYIAPNAPYGQLDITASKIRVGTANGQVAISTEKDTLPIPHLSADFPTAG